MNKNLKEKYRENREEIGNYLQRKIVGFTLWEREILLTEEKKKKTTKYVTKKIGFGEGEGEELRRLQSGNSSGIAFEGNLNGVR